MVKNHTFEATDIPGDWLGNRRLAFSSRLLLLRGVYVAGKLGVKEGGGGCSVNGFLMRTGQEVRFQVGKGSHNRDLILGHVSM